MSNYSKQREIMLGVIKELKTHPTAEELYIAVTKKDNKISKSTVYRNINILLEIGQIKKISNPVGPDRYDYVSIPHNHVICEKCGKIYDLYCKIPENLKQDVNNELSGKISLISNITLNGICYECKSKKNLGGN